MSSAILYLAIVAIWAVVLVPRWLRPRPAPPQPVPVPAEPANAEWREPGGPDAGPAWVASAGGPGAVAGPGASAGPGGGDGRGTVGGPTADEPGGAAGPEADEPAGDEGGEATAPSPVSRRAEVLKARRRLLTTLITLTVIAVALVVTRIDAYWIVIPPAVLLGGYLTLLRKFARIDAERARRAARLRHAAARHAAARAGAEPSASPVPVTPPAAAEPGAGSAPDPAAAPSDAEIIDISSRIGDQVYDQYSDAANRAVGD